MIGMIGMISPTTILTNILIEVFASVLCLVFIICILVAGDLKQKLNRIFLGVLLSNIAVMMSDATAFMNIEKTQPYNFVLNYIGNVGCYLFNYVIIMFFSNYIVTYLSTKIKVKRMAVYIIYGICGVAILLTFVALWNGMYFYIDENNVYHRRDMYWLSQLFGITGLLMSMGIITRNRKHFNRVESFVLANYIVLSVIAVIIQMLFYGFVSVYIASTIAILIIYVGLQNEQAKRLKEQELECYESRVAIMLSQIQPHFLYNALSAIAMLCEAEPAKAKQATVDFAVYLRGNLDSLKNRDPIPFDDELKHIETYLNLEKIRFGDELNIVYDITETRFMIPTLTVQPIVENAVKYGVGKKEDGGTVTISTRKTETDYLVTVSDDGMGFDMSKSQSDGRTHIGIENVGHRLMMQCGGTLTIDSEIGKGTVAVIKIPVKSEDDA